MQLRDLIKPDGKIFIKSEWEPASATWPAVSFSKRTVGETLQREFQPGRDAIIIVGTLSPVTTDEQHRGRLLSALSVEPNQILETKECIPAESWERAQKDHRGRWFWSLPALNIFEIEGFPSAYAPTLTAYDLIPKSYSLLGLLVNRANVVEVERDEREAVLDVVLIPVPFVRPTVAGKFTAQRTLLNLDQEIRWEIGRMVSGILNRVAGSGSEQTTVNPIRTREETNLHIMFGEKWQEQRGLCFLCNGPLVVRSSNYLLQASPDRINELTVKILRIAKQTLASRISGATSPRTNAQSQNLKTGWRRSRVRGDPA
jgi:hypothetical protein